MKTKSETKNPSSSPAGWIWQLLVGLALFVIAAIISLVEIVSQSRKFKKVSIPIEH